MKNKIVASVISKNIQAKHELIQSEWDQLLGVTRRVTDSSGGLLRDVKLEIEQALNDIAVRYGLGMAYVMLHLNGIYNGYIKESNTVIYQGSKYQFVHIPIREYRGNTKKLREKNIFTIPNTIEPIVKHLGVDCFLCSAPHNIFKELLLNVEVNGTGYQVGFTFAPFGNPLDVFHSVMWEKINIVKSEDVVNINDLPNMSYSKKTIPDLIEITDMIHSSFPKDMVKIGRSEEVGKKVLGFYNGWAGNSVYHQHFQFADLDLPILKAKRTILWKKGQLEIEKLEWPIDAYRLTADSKDSLKDLAKEIIDIWQQLSDKKVTKKVGKDSYKSDVIVKVPELSMNLIVVPVVDKKYVLYFVPRMIERVDYKESLANQAFGKNIPGKNNIAVLEVAGYMIVDDEAVINTLKDNKGQSNYQEEADNLLEKPLQSMKVDEGLIKRFEVFLDNDNYVH